MYKLHPSWVTRLVCAYTGEKNYGPRTPRLCSLSLDLVTAELCTLESCLLGSTQGLPCKFTLEACYPLPAVLVVYLLILSLANYILLSPVCWIALEGHPAGLPLRLVIPCLRCLGLPGWRALKGCPAGLPLRLDSWTVSSCSCSCSGPCSCSSSSSS